MRAKKILLALLVVAAVITTLSALYIPVKAKVAQVLLNIAWDKSLTTHEQIRPWPWADTYPVFKLSVSRQHDYIVLSGVTGRTLAFAPGFMQSSFLPGQGGTTVVSAHRDTHFAILQETKVGDELAITARDGVIWQYRVVSINVVDIRYSELAIEPVGESLLLLTCYPFDALSPHGPQRYVVHAEKI